MVSLGETLLSNGGEISRTNELMYLAAEQFGLEQFNAFTIANGVFVSALVDGQQCACQVRHVPLTSIHLGRVEALNELSRHISAGEVTPEQARDAVARIRTIRGARPQSQILAAAVGSCFFCLIFRRRVAGLRSGVLYGYPAVRVQCVCLLPVVGAQSYDLSHQRRLCHTGLLHQLAFRVWKPVG